MSDRALDHHGRWRSLTIAFRISPEENEGLNARVRLSGMTKQDYVISRCLDRDIVVMGNPRVHKALQDTMAEILRKLDNLPEDKKLNDPELLDIIKVTAETMTGLSKPLGTLTRFENDPN